MKYRNRMAAGQLLAERVMRYQASQALVLAMPRGGIPVGFEIAKALGVPLDVLVARRLWAPGQPELAIGAVAPGVKVLDECLIADLELSAGYVETVAAEQTLEVERCTRHYRAGLPPLNLAGQTVVLVDDGLATGCTAAAALQSARQHGPRYLICATPVASAAGLRATRHQADEVCCLREVADFGTVSQWYEDFSPPSEAEVMALLQSRRRPE
jgi:putative phosphoribosyl transferase